MLSKLNIAALADITRCPACGDRLDAYPDILYAGYTYACPTCGFFGNIIQYLLKKYNDISSEACMKSEEALSCLSLPSNNPVYGIAARGAKVQDDLYKWWKKVSGETSRFRDRKLRKYLAAFGVTKLDSTPAEWEMGLGSLCGVTTLQEVARISGEPVPRNAKLGFVVPLYQSFRKINAFYVLRQSAHEIQVIGNSEVWPGVALPDMGVHRKFLVLTPELGYAFKLQSRSFKVTGTPASVAFCPVLPPLPHDNFNADKIIYWVKQLTVEVLSTLALQPGALLAVWEMGDHVRLATYAILHTLMAATMPWERYLVRLLQEQTGIELQETIDMCVAAGVVDAVTSACETAPETANIRMLFLHTAGQTKSVAVSAGRVLELPDGYYLASSKMTMARKITNFTVTFSHITKSRQGDRYTGVISVEGTSSSFSNVMLNNRGIKKLREQLQDLLPLSADSLMHPSMLTAEELIKVAAGFSSPEIREAENGGIWKHGYLRLPKCTIEEHRVTLGDNPDIFDCTGSGIFPDMAVEDIKFVTDVDNLLPVLLGLAVIIGRSSRVTSEEHMKVYSVTQDSMAPGLSVQAVFVGGLGLLDIKEATARTVMKYALPYICDPERGAVPHWTYLNALKRTRNVLAITTPELLEACQKYIDADLGKTSGIRVEDMPAIRTLTAYGIARAAGMQEPSDILRGASAIAELLPEQEVCMVMEAWLATNTGV